MCLVEVGALLNRFKGLLHAACCMPLSSPNSHVRVLGERSCPSSWKPVSIFLCLERRSKPQTLRRRTMGKLFGQHKVYLISHRMEIYVPLF